MQIFIWLLCIICFACHRHIYGYLYFWVLVRFSAPIVIIWDMLGDHYDLVFWMLFYCPEAYPAEGCLAKAMSSILPTNTKINNSRKTCLAYCPLVRMCIVSKVQPQLEKYRNDLVSLPDLWDHSRRALVENTQCACPMKMLGGDLSVICFTSQSVQFVATDQERYVESFGPRWI